MTKTQSGITLIIIGVTLSGIGRGALLQWEQDVI